MEDIDQDRFALMSALTRAHMERPDDYPNPGTLIPMSDEDLSSYATDLLHSLEAASTNDSVAYELEKELRGILKETQ